MILRILAKFAQALRWLRPPARGIADDDRRQVKSFLHMPMAEFDSALAACDDLHELRRQLSELERCTGFMYCPSPAAQAVQAKINRLEAAQTCALGLA
jgi:hypothetical protein